MLLDLASLPGLLVAGAPSSGITAAARAMLLSLMMRQSPDECRLLLIGASLVTMTAGAEPPHPNPNNPRGKTFVLFVYFCLMFFLAASWAVFSCECVQHWGSRPRGSAAN